MKKINKEKLDFIQLNKIYNDSTNQNKTSFTFLTKYYGNEPSKTLYTSSTNSLYSNQKIVINMKDLDPKNIHKMYWEEKKSLPEIAQIFGTYHQKIHRLMLKHGIPLRSRAESVILKKKKLKISKEELYELYWKKEMKLEDIGKLFGVTGQTIRRELQKYGITRRTYSEAKAVQRRKISPEELASLYLNEKMPIYKLAKYVKTRFSTVRKMLVQQGINLREAREALIKHERKSFSGDEVEKYYLIGLRVGDLHVYRDGKSIVVSTSSTHPAMITLFQNIFGRYGYCYKYPRKTKLGYDWSLKCYLDLSFEFLLEKDQIRLPTQSQLFFAFLAGYADAEGCWKITRKKKKFIEFRFDLETQDIDILTYIKGMLEKLGFTPKFHQIKKMGERIGSFVLKKDMYRLSLCRRDEIVRLAQILFQFIKHAEKRQKIELLLKLKDIKRYDEIKDRIEIIRSEIKKEISECITQAKVEYIARKNGGEINFK